MTDKHAIMFSMLKAMNICHDEGLLDAVISAVSTLAELDDEEKQQLHDVLAVSRARLHEQSEGIYWEIDRMLTEGPTGAENAQVAPKPCPFCGGTMLHVYNGQEGIRCEGCGAKIVDCEDAIERWNRRAEE